jgi:hypothetical protein
VGKLRDSWKVFERLMRVLGGADDERSSMHELLVKSRFTYEIRITCTK